MNSDQIKRAVEAKQAYLGAVHTLWNARLEIVVAAGDVQGILDILDEDGGGGGGGGNNCECNRPCNVLGQFNNVIDPALRRMR